MESGASVPPPGLRQLNLKKSFKLGVRSLLTTCSKDEFMNAFSTFDKAKQEALYQIFVQVVISLHQSIEDEFETICLETNVGNALDTIEQLVEEQALDILSDDNSSLVDANQKVSKTREDEVAYLTSALEKVVKQNHDMKAQINSLKKESLNSSGTIDAVEMLRRWNSNYLELPEE